MHTVPRRNIYVIPPPLRIHPPFHCMNTLHILPLIALGLPLLDPQLLEIHVRAIEDARRVSLVRALLTAEKAELR